MAAGSSAGAASSAAGASAPPVTAARPNEVRRHSALVREGRGKAEMTSSMVSFFHHGLVSRLIRRGLLCGGWHIGRLFVHGLIGGRFFARRLLRGGVVSRRLFHCRFFRGGFFRYGLLDSSLFFSRTRPRQLQPLLVLGSGSSAGAVSSAAGASSGRKSFSAAGCSVGSVAASSSLGCSQPANRHAANKAATTEIFLMIVPNSRVELASLAFSVTPTGAPALAMAEAVHSDRAGSKTCYRRRARGAGEASL